MDTRRDEGERFPHPLPVGWFQVAYADDLRAGEVKPLRYFGGHQVLFRTEEGVPALLDAFCPHLGAHLGHGGEVREGGIQCPFHAWRFDVDGRCVEVPYAKKIPPKAALRPWPLLERNGMLFAWYHPEGEAPSWEIPRIEEAESDAWTPFTRHEWEIRTWNQEIGENGVDRAHFRYVHGTTTVPRSELHLEGHVRRAIQHVSYDTKRGPVEGTIEVRAYGMGFTVTRFSGLCETLLLLSHTPIEGGLVHSRFAFTQPRELVDGPKGKMAKGVVADVVKQMNEDIPIWENKVYQPRPVLCDGDGPIGEYRKWASQFYV